MMSGKRHDIEGIKFAKKLNSKQITINVVITKAVCVTINFIAKIDNESLTFFPVLVSSYACIGCPPDEKGVTLLNNCPIIETLIDVESELFGYIFFIGICNVIASQSQ